MGNTGVCLGGCPEADNEGSVGVFIGDIQHCCARLVMFKTVNGGSDHVEVTDFLNGESVGFQSFHGHLLSVFELIDRLSEDC